MGGAQQARHILSVAPQRQRVLTPAPREANDSKHYNVHARSSATNELQTTLNSVCACLLRQQISFVRSRSSAQRLGVPRPPPSTRGGRQVRTPCAQEAFNFYVVALRPLLVALSS
jgi:hypothetical protein